MTDKQATIAAGSWFEQPFQLTTTTTVRYELFEREGGNLQVCLIEHSEARYWENGQAVQGWACHDKVNTYNDQATLQPGTYDLALRCLNFVDTCVLTYSLSLYY